MGYFTPRFVFQTSLLVAVCYMTMDFVVTRYEDKVNLIPSTDSLKSDDEKWTKSFQGFNNETGADRFIVPNIIHFIRFNQPEYSFIDYVVMKAAMRNHRPDYFYIHTDAETVRRVRNTNGSILFCSGLERLSCGPFVPEPTSFTGRYWALIQKDYELWTRIRLFHLEAPTNILGQPINNGSRFHHGSDVQRIRILIQFGGIYLDNDVYVIQNLDKYRKFECAINWQGKELGNQVIIAHKKARFLGRWLDSYRDYKPDSWYYNAGEKPVKEILIPNPELVHRVNGRFDSDPTTVSMIYYKTDLNWRPFDTIHLLINWRSTGIDPHYDELPEFNETNIQSYEYPFGKMAREVLNDSPGSQPVLIFY